MRRPAAHGGEDLLERRLKQRDAAVGEAGSEPAGDLDVDRIRESPREDDRIVRHAARHVGAPDQLFERVLQALVARDHPIFNRIKSSASRTPGNRRIFRAASVDESGDRWLKSPFFAPEALNKASAWE